MTSLRGDRPGPQGRAGFTLIELTIVLSIAVLLSAMTVTSVIPSMRQAAITAAAAAVREASATAGSLALAQVGGAGGSLPGVLLARRGGAWAVATVRVPMAELASPTFDHAITDQDGRPSIQVWSANAVLWLGDDPAPATTTLSWYFEPGTGRVVVPAGSGLRSGMVGYLPPPISGETVYGASSSYGAPEVLAAPTADNPGLSVRSRDQRTRRLIIVQPTDSLLVREF